MTRIMSLITIIILAMFSILVMLGWIFHLPFLIQPYPTAFGMTFNTSFLFLLSSMALLAYYAQPCVEKSKYQIHTKFIYKYIIAYLALFIFIFSSTVLFQYLLNVNLGIDSLFIKPWLQDPNPMPGRMAPGTTICFLLTGAALALIPYAEKKYSAILLQFIYSAILILAIIAIVINSLELQFIFNWYQYTRMAPSAAIAFILISLSLWLLAVEMPWFKNYYNQHDDRKIIATAGVLLTVLTLSAGIGSLVMFTHYRLQTIQRSFKLTLNSKINFFLQEINVVTTTVSNFQNKIIVLSAAHGMQDAAKIAEIFSNQTMTVRLYGKNHELLYARGEFIQPQIGPTSLQLAYKNTLFWNNGFWLNLSSFIIVSPDEQYTLTIEAPLTIFNAIYKDTSGLGLTGETTICSSKPPSGMQCYPSRLTPKLFYLPNILHHTAMPMSFALKGESGAMNGLDNRQARVFAAYAPIADTGIGMVTKIDADEIYRSVQDQVMYTFPIALILITLGLILLRLQIVPMVKRVTESEREAIKAQQRLKLSEERYESAIKASNTGLWDWEVGTQNVYYSQQIRESLGYEEDEFPQTLQTFRDILYPEDKGKVREIAGLHLNSNTPFDVELRLKTKQGNYEWFRMQGKSTTGANGTIKMAGSISNISARKHIESLKNEFISVVSHELRTPLTSIRGAICILLGGTMGAFGEKASKLLDIANQNCERLINLINDILDVEKIESGKLKFELSVINLRKLIEEAINANEFYTEKFGVNFVINTQLAIAKVYADPARIMQVLTNLISNAAKFSPHGEAVVIELTKYQRMVRVSIIDKGPGIADEFKSRIFQKFSQADSSSTRNVGGTGLGLSICKAIIEKQGGKINFKNNKNGGTNFYFDLPEWDEPKTSLETATKKYNRILICEDDHAQAAYVQLLLKSAGHEVDIAHTVQQAKHKLESTEYQAILLDLILPDQDGISFIRELKEKEATKNLPIIVLSVIAQRGKEQLDVDAMAVIDWLDKPLDFPRLLLAINSIKKDNTRKPILLHIEDDLDNQKIVENLIGHFCELHSAPTLKKAREILEQYKIDLVITDLTLPDGNATELLPKFTAQQIPVIVFSASELDQQYAQDVSSALVKSKISNETLLSTIMNMINKFND